MIQFRPSLLFSVALCCLLIGSGAALGANSTAPQGPPAKGALKASLALKPNQMWVLKLKAASVGLVICYATKEQFLAEASFASFLSTQADGCIIFNDLKRLYAPLTTTEIKSRLNVINKQGSVAKHLQQNMGWQILPPKLAGSEVLKGLRTKVYTQENVFQMSYTSKHIMSRTSYLDQGEFSQMPEAIAMIVAKITRSRSVDRRIALRETVHVFTLKKDGTVLTDEGTKTHLDLVSFKTEPYDANKFKLPKDYTRSADEMAVLGMENVDGRRTF